MNTAADLTSLEFDESFDAFDSLESDFDFAWSPQNTDLPEKGASREQSSSTRVRFTALAGLTSSSLGLEGKALVTNLSPKGVSLSSTLDLDPGTRVDLTIALGFAADEVTVEAEVLWRRYRDGADTVYGMAFCEPSPTVYDEINQAIQERCEGRVLEWELPWLPEESKVERFSWRAMILGIALGLGGAVGALGLTGFDSAQPTTPIQAKGIRAIATGTTVVVDASPVVEEVVNEVTPVAPIEVSKAPAEPEVAESKLSEEPKLEKQAAGEAKAEKLVQVEAPEVASTKPKVDQVEAMVVPVTAEAAAVEAIGPAWDVVNGMVQFRIPLDQGADGVKWFALSEPNRLVVDVHNGSTPLVKKAYDIEHPWLNSLRVGRYEAKTRFVFDLEKNVKFDGDPTVTASGDWVTMTFKR